jgi:hypothetical protein
VKAVAVVTLAFLFTGTSSTVTRDWAFRTPGGSVYCQLEFHRSVFDSFRCFTPSDGFWIRISPVSAHARVSKGYSDRLRGLRPRGVPLLGLGREWLSSDAALISCRSRRSGLTCKEYDGLSFWLGDSRTYRVYYDAPGFRPNVRPLFRTGHGVWCGIDRDTLEPALPNLLCWRPADGLQLTVAHGAGRPADYERREKARAYRPHRFPLLSCGRTFVWRCRRVDRDSAEDCSTTAGGRVFTCINGRFRLACRNRNGRGFWVNARSFSAF